jgi:RimJ/RimL family protein N-acetyltransferase
VGTERRGLVGDDELRRLAGGERVTGERVVFPEDGLVGDGIRVRLPRADDAAAIARGLSDAKILRDASIGMRYEPTEEAVRERVERLWPELRRTGDVLYLAVADAETDAYLGNVQLHELDWDGAACEIGYWLLPEARGRGRGATAVRLLARWAIEELGMARVEAFADFDNDASLRSLERAGFTREGTLRSVAHAHRGRVDVAVFSLVAADLKTRRSRRR